MMIVLLPDTATVPDAIKPSPLWQALRTDKLVRVPWLDADDSLPHRARRVHGHYRRYWRDAQPASAAPHPASHVTRYPGGLAGTRAATRRSPGGRAARIPRSGRPR